MVVSRSDFPLAASERFLSVFGVFFNLSLFQTDYGEILGCDEVNSFINNGDKKLMPHIKIDKQ